MACPHRWQNGTPAPDRLPGHSYRVDQCYRCPQTRRVEWPDAVGRPVNTSRSQPLDFDPTTGEVG